MRLATDIALIENNAKVGASIAVELASLQSSSSSSVSDEIETLD